MFFLLYNGFKYNVFLWVYLELNLSFGLLVIVLFYFYIRVEVKKDSVVINVMINLF